MLNKFYLLLEKGNKLDPEDRLAVISAQSGSFEFMEFLKSKGYDALEYEQENASTTLHYSVSPSYGLGLKDPSKDYSQKINITNFLLKNGAKAKQEDKNYISFRLPFLLKKGDP